MRGKVVLIAVAVSTVFGCGTITPLADPSDGGTSTVSVTGDPHGGPRHDARPASKKNGEDGQGDQKDKGGNGSGPAGPP